ncbi:MAG: ATP-binding protein [Saprospiraceae bacterium]
MGVNKPFVITIVGAESSGKTTLAMQLAHHFNCAWVPEYAREYLMTLHKPYITKDLEIIAEEQMKRINEVIGQEKIVAESESSDLSNQSAMGNRQSLIFGGVLSDLSSENSALIDKLSIVNGHSSIVIIDGGMMNLRMWARIKYGISLPAAEESLENDITNLYLLCRPQKEWTPDPLREAPSVLERAWIFNQYLKELSQRQVSFEIVSSR